MKKKKRSSLWAVFIAIVLAMVAGSLSGQTGKIFGITCYSVYDIGGSLFLNALMLVVVPLVISSIIVGVAKIGGDAAFKRLGLKTFLFYITTNSLAVLTGLLFVNLFKPGLTSSGESILSASLIGTEGPLVNGQAGMPIFTLLSQIIPSNVFEALAKGNMLGLIFFSLLFGYCLSKMSSKAADTLAEFWQGIFEAMIRITHMILFFLPLGVFFLVAKAFSTSSGSLASLSYFSLSVLSGLILFMFILLPLFMKIVGKVNPIHFFKAMGPALVTAFSTSSSSATLPVTIDCAEKRASISNRVASLVLPLGTTLNVAGTALYDAIAVIFIAQAYGIELTFIRQLLIAALALITSLGIAGVPSGGLVAIIVILKTLGLPPEGIGLFIAADRILDMCRTTVNVMTDSTCALLVARSEGENTLLEKQLNSEL